MLKINTLKEVRREKCTKIIIKRNSNLMTVLKCLIKSLFVINNVNYKAFDNTDHLHTSIIKNVFGQNLLFLFKLLNKSIFFPAVQYFLVPI